MGWIVARTHGQRERTAAENLARQKFIYYLPRIQEEVTSRRAGQIQRLVITKPLFPTYIFIQHADNWRSILGTFGIYGVIPNGDGPAILPQSAIDELKSYEDESGLVVLPHLRTQVHAGRSRFVVGQRVRIVDGPMSGLIGIHQGSTNKEREKILLDYLGRKSTVLIASELLEEAI